MNRVVYLTARLVMSIMRAYSRKWSFLGLFAIVFFSSVAVLGQLDLLPEVSHASTLPTIASTGNQPSAANVTTPIPVAPELPTKIEISKINLSAPIVNPTTTNIEDLDKELLKGAVRYPTSAKLGETGNVVLFGHASYLPVVANQAYKTFNGIQKLVEGDLVTVSSSGMEYTYRVRSVEIKNSTVDGILLSTSGRVLTLVTCNSFGAKEERFIVTADFVESRPLN